MPQKYPTLHLLALLLLAPIPASGAPAAGHITGIGDVFVKSQNPKALAAWYKDVLGINVEKWGGALFATDAPGHPAKTAWNAFGAKSDYFAPSGRDFMLSFAVDNLDAFIAKLATHQVKILARDDSDPHGSFAWILDPDGTKIELWGPKQK